MSNPMKPSKALLIKLGSIIVHLDEYVETDLHMDLKIAQQLMEDAEVVEWMKTLKAQALLPLKRSERH